MPTYVYQCKRCAHEFERVHGMHDEGPQACEACVATDVVRKITASHFVLKGSGWYRDGYGLGEKKEGVSS